MLLLSSFSACKIKMSEPSSRTPRHFPKDRAKASVRHIDSLKSASASRRSFRYSLGVALGGNSAHFRIPLSGLWRGKIRTRWRKSAKERDCNNRPNSLRSSKCGASKNQDRTKARSDAIAATWNKYTTNLVVRSPTTAITGRFCVKAQAHPFPAIALARNSRHYCRKTGHGVVEAEAASGTTPYTATAGPRGPAVHRLVRGSKRALLLPFKLLL